MTEPNILPSYDTSEWGEDCFMLGQRDDEPCWGKVRMIDDGDFVDDDGNWQSGVPFYGCAGHFYWHDPYRRAPKEKH